MSDVLSFNPNRALTANIDAAAAARAFFYDAGTTTLRTVYADSALTIPHASPLVANAAGIFPAVYVDGSAVKVVAQDAAGATLYTLDPCVKVAATGATAAQVSFAPSTAAPYTNVQDAIDDLAVLRNSSAGDRIINGDFGIWQRATSGTANGYTAADRWSNSFTGGTVTQARQAFALGATLGGTNPQFSLRQTVSGQTLAGHFAVTSQNIEGVRSYAGQTITVLGWAKRATGTGNAAIEAVQNFGTGGSPSSSVTGISPTTISLSADWTPFAAVMNIPSITGKTLGSNVNDLMGLLFWSSAGSDFNARTNSIGLQTIGVEWSNIHIRVGTWTATDASLYRPRDPGTELALCQRYYEVVTATSAANGAFVNAFSFATTKRVTPALAVVAGGLSGGTFVVNGPGAISQNANSSGASSVTFGVDAEL